MLRTTTRTIGALGLAAFLLLAAGCGSGGAAGAEVASLDGATTTAAAADDNSTGDEKDAQEAMLAFAKCMRDQGIDFPDPEFDANGKGGAVRVIGKPGQRMDKEKMDAAQEACKHLLPDGGNFRQPDPAEQAKMQEQALAFAQCMREHGIDMPDPQFSDDGNGATVAIGDGKVDPEDDDFQAAQEACEKEHPMFGAATKVDGGSSDAPSTDSSKEEG